VFGGFGYYVPLVYANKAGLNTVMYIQNGGLECSSLEIWFKAPGRLPARPHLRRGDGGPGRDLPVRRQRLRGPGLAGLGLDPRFGVDGRGGGHLRPRHPDDLHRRAGPVRLHFDDGTGDASPSTGEKVAYGPLIYSEYQGWDTGVQVMNLSQVVNAKVKVYFLDRSGDVITTLVDWVCPRGSQTFFLPVVADLPGTWVGSIRVESQDWWTPGTNGVRRRTSSAWPR
jgi:hypothetical protein